MKTDFSLPAAEFTKEFVTSIVVGKDVVPRLGLHQLETLRSSLMTAINKSTDPKWKILASSMLCCGQRKDTASKMTNSPVVSIEEGAGGVSKDVPSTAGVLTKHPSDTNISLSTHQPLYPPGRIIHIVRQHPKSSDRSVELFCGTLLLVTISSRCPFIRSVITRSWPRRVGFLRSILAA